MGHKDQEAKDQEGGDQTAARNQGQPGEAQEEEVIGVYQLVPERVLDLEPVMGDLGPTGFSRAILAPGVDRTDYWARPDDHHNDLCCGCVWQVGAHLALWHC